MGFLEDCILELNIYKCLRNSRNPELIDTQLKVIETDKIGGI